MVEIWVRLIESGVKTLDECPARIKEKVQIRLVEDGYLS